MVDALVCPLCGERNACGMAEGKGACWCFDVTITEDVLARIPADARNVACVCRRCAAGEKPDGSGTHAEQTRDWNIASTRTTPPRAPDGAVGALGAGRSSSR